jgi:hypothetical protein
MLTRTFLSLVNLGVLSGTVVIWFAVPQYSTYALYACLAWVVIAFAMMYSAWGNRPLGTRARSTAVGTPLPSGPTGGGRVVGGASAGAPLDFCIYCAASLPANAGRCPACGHAVARA